MSIILPKRLGVPRFTTWAAFITALHNADPYTVANLVGDLGIIGQGRKNADGALELSGWFDLRLAPASLLTDMFSAVTGIAPTPQAAHASTGGLVIGVNANAQSSIKLNNLLFDGSSRVIEAEFVLDTFDDASISTNHGFGAGFAPASVPVTSTSLRGAGPTKSSSNNYRPSYIYNSLNGFTASVGAAFATSGFPNGTKILTSYACFQNGNIASGTGDAGADLALCSFPGQIAGTGIATPNNTTVHTDKTDLQAIFANFGFDLTNILRLIRFKISGFGVMA